MTTKTYNKNLQKIKNKLKFNRFIYSFFILFFIIISYVAIILTIGIINDLEHASYHDEQLRKKYNLQVERYNKNPDKYPQPQAPDYILIPTIISDLPYMIIVVSIIIFIIMFIQLTFFFLFPPLYDNQRNNNAVLGGIVKIVEYHKKPYLLLKSSYFSKPFLVSIEHVDVKKKINTLFNSLNFIIKNDVSLYAFEDKENNIILKNNALERETQEFDDIDTLLITTLRKGVSRVKTASKSNYKVTIHKEMNKFDDSLLEEANNTLESEFGD